MTLFPEKISIFTPKFSDDLFFSHRPGFSDFAFTVIKCHIPHKKNQYFRKEFLNKTIFLLCSSFRAHPTTLLGGDQCMGRPPHLKFWGGPSPRSPPLLFYLSLG